MREQFSAAELELICKVFNTFDDDWVAGELEFFWDVDPDFFTEVLVKVRILAENSALKSKGFTPPHEI